MPTSLMTGPPRPPKRPTRLVEHGHERVDDYHWLRLTEDQRNTTQPDAHTLEVIAHLKAENTYVDAMMRPVAGLQKKVLQEIRSRIKEDDSSAPLLDNGYWYHLAYSIGEEYPRHYRRRDPDGEPELILDEVALAEGQEHFEVGEYDVSPNNQLLAYSVDKVGRRIYEILLVDLTTGETLKDRIPACNGQVSWGGDNRTLFYVKKDDALRSFQVWTHIIGTDTAGDRCVFTENDAMYSCSVGRSRSNAYMIISTESTNSTEQWLIQAGLPHEAPRVFLKRSGDHEYDIEDLGEGFYIRTNHLAKNFRVMFTPAIGTPIDQWEEVVEHRKDVLIEAIDVFTHFLVVSEREKGIPRLRVIDLRDRSEKQISFNDPAYVAYVGNNPDQRSTWLRYGYNSLTTPPSVRSFNMDTGEDVLIKSQPVLGDFDPNRYTSERIWVKARDGAEIPVSIVYRKGARTTEGDPLLLYGYGAYGITMEPTFSSARLSLLDRGFVFAIAHIRGGEELGRAWYENGRMEHKLNTFNDMIDVGEHLIKARYAHEKKLFCLGGSAGGLLVGAVMNMRPDLWRGVVAVVPFVDVLTTMLDTSLPLTIGEFSEWGDPRDKAVYERLLSYSPYDNVRAVAYPPLLVQSGLHDSQVQFWEPTKWVARLRDMNTGEAPILLWTNLEAGHGGASGRFEKLKETAMIYAFLFQQAGIEE